RRLLMPYMLRDAARAPTSTVPARALGRASVFRIGAALAIAVSLSGLCGCQAKISGVPLSGAAEGPTGTDPGSSGMTPEQVLASDLCKAPSPGRAPLRRLSNAEYRNTIADLL